MCIHIYFLMSIYVLLVCLYIKTGMSIHKITTVYIYSINRYTHISVKV